MNGIVKTLFAALLFILGFTSPAIAQEMCSNGDVMIFSARPDAAPGRINGLNTRQVPVYINIGGRTGQARYEQLLASDAFAKGGVFYGSKPTISTEMSYEFDKILMGTKGSYGEGMLLQDCERMKITAVPTWRRFCEDDHFKLTAFVMSGGVVRPYDIAKLPINPRRCSDPPRKGVFRHDPTEMEWLRLEQHRQDLHGITYRSVEKVMEERQVMLLSSGNMNGESFYFGNNWPDSSNNITLIMILNSGDEVITGVDGVTLRGFHGDKDLVTFYSTITDNYKLYQHSGEERCGVNTLGPFPDMPNAKCRQKCFISYEDLTASKNAVSCQTGGAHWIYIGIGGVLRERRALPLADSNASQVRKAMDVTQRKEAEARARRGERTLAENVDRSGSLVIHVKWKGSDSVVIPIDDAFRDRLWNPAK